MIRITPPKADWRRHHPTAVRIAAELCRWPALSGLRYSRLADDITARFRVGKTTAAVAIRLFRQKVAA